MNDTPADWDWAPDADTERAIAAKWQEIAPLIDRLAERIGLPDDFPVERGSALAGDDRAAHPFRTSSAARQCLNAAIDHLHAAKTLAHDSGVLHLAAPATLARGVIENAATGLWIVMPTRRDERVLRTLRWFATNYHDLAKVAQPDRDARRARGLGRIGEVAAQRGLDPGQAKARCVTTTVLETIGRDLHGIGDPLFAWRLCSGFAHGRPWAYLGGLSSQRLGSSVDGVTAMRQTSTSLLATYPILTGMHLLEEFIRLRDRRAGIHYSPPAAPAFRV